MKQHIWIAALALAVSAGFSSCTKDEGPLAQQEMSSEREAIPVPGELMTGRWMIEEFILNGHDMTSDFTGYIFRFYPGGVLRADGDAGTASGQWMFAPNDNPLTVMIEFGTRRTFFNLTAEWHIILISETSFVLEYAGDNNGFDGGNHRMLRFKNVLPPV
jgi:hypothetical protein